MHALQTDRRGFYLIGYLQKKWKRLLPHRGLTSSGRVLDQPLLMAIPKLLIPPLTWILHTRNSSFILTKKCAQQWQCKICLLPSLFTFLTAVINSSCIPNPTNFRDLPDNIFQLLLYFQIRNMNFCNFTSQIWWI